MQIWIPAMVIHQMNLHFFVFFGFCSHQYSHGAQLATGLSFLWARGHLLTRGSRFQSRGLTGLAYGPLRLQARRRSEARGERAEGRRDARRSPRGTLGLTSAWTSRTQVSIRKSGSEIERGVKRKWYTGYWTLSTTILKHRTDVEHSNSRSRGLPEMVSSSNALNTTWLCVLFASNLTISSDRFLRWIEMNWWH